MSLCQERLEREGFFPSQERIAQARKAITSQCTKRSPGRWLEKCLRLGHFSKALKCVGTLFDNGLLVTYVKFWVNNSNVFPKLNNLKIFPRTGLKTKAQTTAERTLPYCCGWTTHALVTLLCGNILNLNTFLYNPFFFIAEENISMTIIIIKNLSYIVKGEKSFVKKYINPLDI